MIHRKLRLELESNNTHCSGINSVQTRACVIYVNYWIPGKKCVLLKGNTMYARKIVWWYRNSLYLLISSFFHSTGRLSSLTALNVRISSNALFAEPSCAKINQPFHSWICRVLFFWCTLYRCFFIWNPLAIFSRLRASIDSFSSFYLLLTLN